MAQAQPRSEADSAPGLEALSVLLKQHDLFQEQRTLLTLLGCSKAVRKLVHAEFRGRLHVCMPTNPDTAAGQQPGRHADSYRLWLAQHAPLLHTLSLTLSGPADEAAVAAGLSAAATIPDLAPAGEEADTATADPPALLPLVSLEVCFPTSGELLAAVARSSSPTSLLLTLERDSKAERSALSAALASLTSLQQLTLRPASGTAYMSQLGGALVGLSGLRHLRLSSKVLLQAADVQLLPTGSLQVLSLSSRTRKDGRLGRVRVDDEDPEYRPDPSQWTRQVAQLQALDLTPLSSLKKLGIRDLTARDKLPPSLEGLILATPHSFKPVLQCTSLQTLSINDKQCLTPWQELRRVSAGLKGLQSVSVELGNPFGCGYGGGEFMPWPTGDLHEIGECLAGVKQLKQLHVEGFYLLPSFVNGLGRYSQLTHLTLRHCAQIQDKNGDLTWECIGWTKAEAAAHMRGFAAALKKLQQLQHLELVLKLVEMQGEDDEDRDWRVTDAELQPLVQAVSGLPAVQHVYLTGDRSGALLINGKP